MQDEFYIKHMVDKQVLGPILDVLLRTLPRDNLLSSACLELFMLVNKENIKELIKQMVENYREKVMALAYMDIFNEILNRYDQTQGFTTNIDPYFESEDELGRGRPANVAGAGARGMMEHLAVDQAQEDYWNTSDDEEDLAGSGQEPSEEELRRTLGIMAADRSPSKPLVEYNSDEEADEADGVARAAGGDTVMTPADTTTTPTLPSTGDAQPTTTTATTTTTTTTPSPTTPTHQTNGTPPTSSSSSSSSSATAAAAAAAAAAPPERLSEKRRREEDEEDDALDKLTQHKRRNSSSAAANANTTPQVSAAMLRKKRSFSGHGGTAAAAGGGGRGGGAVASSNGAGGVRKIAISISPGVKTAATATATVNAGEDGGGGGE